MGTCQSDRINKFQVSVWNFNMKMEFNAVLETPLAVETWSDEYISITNCATTK